MSSTFKTTLMKKFEEREAVSFICEGQKIFGILHLPLTSNPPPVVLMCHGFGGSKVGRYRHYVKLSEALSKEGIASFRFDFRGSGDSEGEMKEVTIDGEVKDALMAMDLLAKNKSVDSSRMGLLGRSLGGAIAVKAAAQRKGVKSIALWAPLFSTEKWKAIWKEIKKKPSEFEQVKELKFFGGVAPNQNFLEQFFQIHLEEELSCLQSTPLLHIHGVKDQVVDHTQSEKYADCRKDSKGKTKMISLPYTDHDFSNLPEEKLAIEETVKWFKESL